jgi:hypothetical protein
MLPLLAVLSVSADAYLAIALGTEFLKVATSDVSGSPRMVRIDSLPQ